MKKLIIISILAMVSPMLAQPPNIVFILADDQGWNGLSTRMDPDVPGSKSDYHRTPNLDRLCREGMRFSQGYAPATVCTPTRNSILFGVSPAKARITRIAFDPAERQFGDPAKALPNLIKQAAPRYVAAHYGKWHIEDMVPAACGYDDSDGETTNEEGNRKPNGDKNDADDPKRVKEVTRRAERFIEAQVRAGKPFFLQISHYADHAKFVATPEMREKYAGLESGKIHFDPELAGMNEDLDLGVGAILNKLDELGIASNTYVFYTSDNGWDIHRDASSTKSWPLKHGKTFVHEGGMRVPFIVRGPGIAANSVSDVPVIGYDLMATFLDIVKPGTKPPAFTEGGSLKPVLENGGLGTVERPGDSFVFHSPIAFEKSTSMRKGDYKLIYEWKTGAFSLYDLSKDIGEKKDIRNQKPELADAMHREMMTYLKSVNAQIPDEASLGRKTTKEGGEKKKTGEKVNKKKEQRRALRKAAREHGE